MRILLLGHSSKHGVIDLFSIVVDTKAAHLDRSRAKAVLQRLASRIHYQRTASIKSGAGTARPRNLLAYFNGSGGSV